MCSVLMEMMEIIRCSPRNDLEEEREREKEIKYQLWKMCVWHLFDDLKFFIDIPKWFWYKVILLKL